jgi:uncharacterized protein (DUF433 family)
VDDTLLQLYIDSPGCQGNYIGISVSKEHAMDHPRIQCDPTIMMGKPVIRGTHLTVEHILRCLAAGHTVEQLLSGHPRLTVEDIRAAQAFAADYLAHESVFAIQ